MNDTINKGFVPGNYVQNLRTFEVYKLDGYVSDDNTIKTTTNRLIFIQHLMVVETVPCCCRHKYFLGKILLKKKTKEKYIECPHCNIEYFFENGEWVNNQGHTLKVFYV